MCVFESLYINQYNLTPTKTALLASQSHSIVSVSISKVFLLCVGLEAVVAATGVELLVLALQRAKLLPQLHDVLLLHLKVALDRIIKSVYLLELVVGVGVSAASALTIGVSALRVQLLLLLLDLIK